MMTYENILGIKDGVNSDDEDPVLQDLRRVYESLPKESVDSSIGIVDSFEDYLDHTLNVFYLTIKYRRMN